MYYSYKKFKRDIKPWISFELIIELLYLIKRPD